MLSENQLKMLKALYEERLDLYNSLVGCDEEKVRYKEKLKLVESAIINLEGEKYK